MAGQGEEEVLSPEEMARRAKYAEDVNTVGYTLYRTLVAHDLQDVIPSLKQLGVNNGRTFFLLSLQDVDTLVESHGCNVMKGRLLQAKISSGELKSFYTWADKNVSVRIFEMEPRSNFEGAEVLAIMFLSFPFSILCPVPGPYLVWLVWRGRQYFECFLIVYFFMFILGKLKKFLIRVE